MLKKITAIIIIRETEKKWRASLAFKRKRMTETHSMANMCIPKKQKNSKHIKLSTSPKSYQTPIRIKFIPR